MRVRGLIVAATLASVPAWATVASATLDPSHAQADIDGAMREKAYPFCREPHTPLSWRAEALCGQATAIPDCGGYATECAKTTTPPSIPSWWHWLSLPPFLGVAAQIIVWLLVAALVVAVLIPIVRAIARLGGGGSKRLPKTETAPPDDAQPSAVSEVVNLTDEEQLLARADALVARGDFAAALQLYLAASLRALDKRGALRITRDRTNGEYVRACGDPGAKPALRDIVREVDRVQFGKEDATRDTVARAAQRALAIVRALPVTLLVLVLTGSLGCGGISMPKGHKEGDDPAGAELFHELLRRQGVNVRGLETSLATMPLPKAGERGPAVIVDMDTTAADEETQEHLASWVEAGGMLVLAGSPVAWPKRLEASSKRVSTGPNRITARRLLARAVPPEPGESEDTADASESAIYARTTERGELSSDRGFAFKDGGDRVAWFDDGTVYASVLKHGDGYVLGIATDELLTNVGLARPGNAAALVAILASTSRTEMRIADPEDGVAPPSTPIAALLRAGLGMGLGHAVFFTVVLFVAVGTRLARPKPVPPPRRRAFVEHVEAVGALYGKTRNAAHALAAYARFADERLRARMPRSSGDVAAFLASRAGMPLEGCQRLWVRAMQAKAGAPALGDELSVLRELSALFATAMARE